MLISILSKVMSLPIDLFSGCKNPCPPVQENNTAMAKWSQIALTGNGSIETLAMGRNRQHLFNHWLKDRRKSL